MNQFWIMDCIIDFYELFFFIDNQEILSWYYALASIYYTCWYSATVFSDELVSKIPWEVTQFLLIFFTFYIIYQDCLYNRNLIMNIFIMHKYTKGVVLAHMNGHVDRLELCSKTKASGASMHTKPSQTGIYFHSFLLKR